MWQSFERGIEVEDFCNPLNHCRLLGLPHFNSVWIPVSLALFWRACLLSASAFPCLFDDFPVHLRCCSRDCMRGSVLLCSRLCPSTARSALRQSPPTFSVLRYSCSYCSLLPHYVISPTTFWSSNWSYALYLPLCASNSPSVVFHSGDVSSPFPFRIGYVFDYVTVVLCLMIVWRILSLSLTFILAFSFPWFFGFFQVSLLMLL